MVDSDMTATMERLVPLSPKKAFTEVSKCTEQHLSLKLVMCSNIVIIQTIQKQEVDVTILPHMPCRCSEELYRA